VVTLAVVTLASTSSIRAQPEWASTNLEEVDERSETGGGNYGKYGLIAVYQTPAIRP
jgi:hypothetical protein